MTGQRSPQSLQRDAADLYDASTVFIRIYQFRDRNQALRFGLTVVQAYALDILVFANGQRLTQLAAALRLDKSTTSRIVAGMKRRGLIKVSRPGSDGRAMWIVASTEGRRRYARLRGSIIREQARLLASYSPAERRAAIKILRQLAARALSSKRVRP